MALLCIDHVSIQFFCFYSLKIHYFSIGFVHFLSCLTKKFKNLQICTNVNFMSERRINFDATNLFLISTPQKQTF